MHFFRNQIGHGQGSATLRAKIDREQRDDGHRHSDDEWQQLNGPAVKVVVENSIEHGIGKSGYEIEEEQQSPGKCPVEILAVNEIEHNGENR